MILAPEIVIKIGLIIYYLLQAYMLFMVLVIILSWIPGIHEKKFYQVMDRISDFYLGRFKGWLTIGILDFTPMLGIIIYELALNALRFILLRFM